MSSEQSGVQSYEECGGDEGGGRGGGGGCGGCAPDNELPLLICSK